MKELADFEVWVEPPGDANGHLVFPTRVISSPAGPVAGQMKLDLEDESFRSDLARVRGLKPDLEVRKRFGGQLYSALFNGAVGNTWNQSIGKVEGSDRGGLRLRLMLQPPSLGELPWELLWSEERGFLATSANQAVSRYLPVPEPPYFNFGGPLRVLLIVEEPAGLPPIGDEIDRIEVAIASLDDLVEYEKLHNVTIADIQAELQNAEYHVLHFLGHGRKGKLALVDPQGDPRPIHDSDFAQLFQGRRCLRLAVLNACHSSQPEGGDLFSGVGPSLVRMRVPAVVAMQYPSVDLDTAGQFSERFYGVLAKGIPVDVAVNEARQYLSAGDHLGSRDWSTPVLYMGTRGGVLLELLSDDDEAVGNAWESVQKATEDSDQARTALRRIAKRFDEVALRSNRMREWLELERHYRDLEASLEFFKGELERELKRRQRTGEEEQEAVVYSWKRCREAITELQVFANGIQHLSSELPSAGSEADVPSWVSELGALADKIQEGLDEGNLTELLAPVKRLENALMSYGSERRHRVQNEVLALGELTIRLRTLTET